MQIKTKTLKSQNNIFHNMMIFACSYHFKAHLITSESWRLSSEQVYGNIFCKSKKKLHSFVHLQQ